MTYAQTYAFIYPMHYEWDKEKAKSNFKKHGVLFSDAVLVLEDDHALTIEDDEAEGETRFITLGEVSFSSVLVVIWTERVNDVIRIISARKATKHEKRMYQQ
ncbi:MAG: BrnT family toxin [Mariprofundaceae bacterium]|nr:BrnT family toxin [Mariprofundaceae bacterium]